MTRVLFVCLGNICRSTMAEAVFKHKVEEAGLSDQIEADSAGTGSWHLGEPPHPGTMRILAQNNISYEHRARLILRRDLEEFNYIITMDEMNFRDVQALGEGKAEVFRLLDFAPQTGVSEVPDPYYTGGYEEVHSLVKQGTAGLLEHLKKNG